MNRPVLLAVLSAGLFACHDASSPNPSESVPALAKTTSGGVAITSIFSGKEGGQAEDVNDAGQVVGYTENQYYQPLRAFLWTPAQPRGTTGTVQDLGTLGGSTAMAKAINNSGHVVGNTGTGPFLWTQSGGMQSLGLAPGWTSGSAQDINESGQVAGMVQTEVGQRAAIWTVNVGAGGEVQVTGRETLGIPPGWESSIALAVNSAGQVAGWISNASDPNHAVLWTPSPSGWIMADLGSLSGDFGSTAYGINDQGQVVGVSMPHQGCFHPVLWSTQNGIVTAMRALETATGCGEAWAINNQGRVTGRSPPPHGANQATLWTLAPDGVTATIQYLGTLSGTSFSLGMGLSSTFGGTTQVGGLSQPTSGNLRATLWTVR
jgi:probable HAF family extracellular repeat protein